ncbi:MULTISPECIES: mechanosensitive ion channel [Okeania]|uniref:Mechanosensitive ion channel n=1 Tax=Okeania hirsuta TaxID=1458930 RepID=A0A3N6P843_9CYAN|nr:MULTISPECIES: mechanosensitive ion channel [Okeania]NET14229.1 mechanosensitive ion channel [Okeania sp. SIO1H6]NES75320.1 mechanosensitive ion channel [Okeania sp. SIO1H4]NES92867.1 mechanosensitive ion channel [Okeania sp. SIO2B9]NET19141.1 mechanosensitive ion channel [Okeania sp. SIO1H5]NET74999.1 mechanosensitive ion channel [Okeania sp. SIO1F9]
MNGTWQIITQSISEPIQANLMLASNILAQTEANPVNIVSQNFTAIAILDIVTAIAILVVGWIVAWILSSFLGGLFKKTKIDNKIAGWVTGSQEQAQNLPVEKWISSLIFWIIMIFVLIAFFDKLNLTAVSEPLNAFLTEITSFLPNVAAALIWLGIAWLVATIAKLAVTKGLRTFGLDDRLNQQVSDGQTENQVQISDTIANAIYWLIFLLFLPVILEALQLQIALQPVQNIVDQILQSLPRILKAVILAGVGWLVATVVKKVVTNLLAATGVDQIGSRFGMSQTTGGQNLSSIIGTVVYVLILIPVAIAALSALDILAITTPAVAMLNDILTFIPKIFAAAVILVVAYFVGRFVSDLVTNLLTSVGFNNLFNWLGLSSTQPASDPNATVIQGEPGTPGAKPTARTPSEIAGIVAFVGIILFATVSATQIMELEALTLIVNVVIYIAGRVLYGLVVLAIGLYLANLAYNLITSSGNSQARLLGQLARIGIIVLVSAMALQQMGIAPSIVNLAFGLFMGAMAVAIALAFGLGGRDIASSKIQEWLEQFKNKK